MAQWAIEYAIGGAVVTACAWGLAQWTRSAGWGWPLGALPWAVGAVSVLLTVVAPVWRYRVHRWEVASDVIFTRSGWVTRQWLLVPVSRIQTVDAQQGWLERVLGLATLKISTASHEGSSELAGLVLADATELAGELAWRAHALRDDAT